ncbi:hypothetical protein F4825DRAFT_464373 [Nemania diffusa]|nr:hypothetical protein F4825DRAFT_464373 [Nemania diffusa]
MTGNSPRLWAAADLDPISPSPVHPPSPITVPALQDQADAYNNTFLANSNPMILSAAIPDSLTMTDGEQARMPAAAAAVAGAVAAVTAITTHNNIQDRVPDMPPSDVGCANPEKNVNGVAERTVNVSVGIPADNMQEPDTPRPNTTEDEQDGSKSTEPTTVSDTSTPSSIYENIAPLPKISNGACPHLVPQPTHELLEDSQVVSVAAVSNVDNTRLSQLLSEMSPTDNNDCSPAAGHVNHLPASIQALVGNITAHVANGDADVAHIPVSDITSTSDALSQSSILPPKPPTQAYYSTEEIPQANNVPWPMSNGANPATYTGPTPDSSAGVAPGTGGSCASVTSMLDTTSISNDNLYILSSDYKNGLSPFDQNSSTNHKQQQWDTFLQEERRYVSEAKWDRFPDGSRLFIGNLSSERASKREVFNIFSKYGRLAQISLKQAYGFVQYHEVAEGQAAMDNLQGMEIRGKKINLEFSRTQKKDHEGGRGNRGRRGNDNNRGRRDDHRLGRQPSPRRSHDRYLPPHESNHRGWDYQESNYSSDRRRSQSPGYTRHDSYRRRSLSPRRRYGSGSDLALPRRYGADVPDVQFLILQSVTGEFVSWAQAAFTHQGLRCDVMLLDPQFSRDTIIQHQILEGVHAVVELDVRAEERGRLSLQVFDRSAGYNNVRFDQYQDLEPAIAAQLVTKAKFPPHVAPAAHHNNHFPPAQRYPPPAQRHYIPASYTSEYYSPPMANGTGGTPLDTATVYKILGSVNGHQTGPPAGTNSVFTAVGTAPQDMGGPIQHSTNYGHLPPNVPQGVPCGNNSARHVEDIMTQLSRYRQ